ncbi:hypothetical protein [Caballeronia novacaledonica]|uniref:Uncharacterized protein n=1 Tax=Caballeronia novacaledonica TaxID=1544861 RepID=A0AA37IKA0_9BURK|nr:hypothetical protein [Caballeronia novacaledonica]GJH27830.1 hypothetical protein CBA19CS42_24960 [Caballeronia novacaledonica]
MTATVSTNFTKGSIASVSLKRKVRLVLWGGAYATSDNSTFEWAAKRVIKDYTDNDKQKYEIIFKRIDSAESFALSISDQNQDSIHSLDLFTHGGPDHFFMVSVRQEQGGGLNKFKWYRYLFHNSSLSRGDLEKLQYERFAEDAKVEFHGCQTAKEPKEEDNIAADFSRFLFIAGKTHSAVIGHVDKANPNRPVKSGVARFIDQDYRWGQRAIYKDGNLKAITRQEGATNERAFSK